MIDYETFSKIHDCHDRQGLTIAQTARALGLDPRTVARWLAHSRFEPRRSRPRGSVLDPFKPRITRLLDTHPYSAEQIFQRLREEGYRGGVTILRDYVRRIRPTKRPVYLKLHFAPGDCAQVDWGAYGTVAVGNTRRRLSFFVMVLAFSRQMFVEFTVSQTMEHFLACHEHGFAALGGVPSKIKRSPKAATPETARDPMTRPDVDAGCSRAWRFCICGLFILCDVGAFLTSSQTLGVTFCRTQIMDDVFRKLLANQGP